ncbi:hypothetical protein CVT25_010344 [Psilocybe cyanescens]|uniref:Protein-S-isoprenylcysteine O-methyltransferase n=1 Tax=Psilocybe cyanescens TaxID=93625 RepID=A0A409XP11_PSICY|nr:hypothetical protein CVT25_010344 [Psilocybe cyanescens]
MSVEKIPAILLTAIGVHVCAQSPTPVIPEDERKMKDGPMDIQVGSLIIKAAFWIHSAIELMIIGGAVFCPESTMYKQALGYLLPVGQGSDRIFLSPYTAVAAILIVVGATIRYLCYRELGRHFTFQVTVLKGHKLVTTGPYAYARHPAYTGSAMAIGGIVMWFMAQGSWLRESCTQTGGDWAAVLLPASAVVFTLIFVANVLRRIPTEDRLLKEQFGEEWEVASPPTPGIPKRERKAKDGPLGVRIASLILRTVSWLHAAIELIRACWLPKSERVEQLLDYLLPDASRMFLSPTTGVATMMMVVGSMIRYKRYQEMGRHFTFHVTVLKDHKLVTTGLYSIIRHPGYTGLVLNFAGLYM